LDNLWGSFDTVVLGVDPDSISRRARRAGWSRQPGNDGRTRVAVPLDVLPKSPADVRPKTAPDAEADSPPENRADKGGHVPGDESRTIKALEDELATVREALARERERADAAQATADRRAEDLIEARDRLESALAMFRAAEAEQRERLGRAAGEVVALREAVEREAAARQAAEARAARDGARADQEAAARRAAEVELAGWTVGGPLVRAWRAFLRGRA
jgi:hypothetical protein